VRNTPSVTGFVGTGIEPTPVEGEEIEKIMKRMGRDEPKHKIDYNIGDIVSIIDGPFKGYEGAVNEIDAQKGKLKVLVSMFGRETPVELDSLQVKKTQ
jgi:transcriptional antiterminator NusG